MEILNEKSIKNIDENLMSQKSVAEVIPKWLNKELIQNALRKYLNDNLLMVDRIIVNNCGGCGESYASMMFRVAAFYHHQNSSSDIKEKSVIIKTLPQNEMALEKLGDKHYNVQNKEMTFYEKLIPEFEKILAKIGENGKTFPSVMAVYRELDVIFLEDLKEKNFIMADRLKGLDVEHTKMSLQGLARIHAASLILYEKDKSFYQGFDFGLYNRKTQAFDLMYLSSLVAFTEEVNSWTEWKESCYYADKLRKLQKTLIENGCKAFDLNENDLNVFNHGDFWTNNIMFSYVDNKPKEVKIIDFQYSFFGSATLDLLYFLFSSLPDHLRVDKMEEFVQFYYYELKELLQKLKYDIKKLPFLQNFQIEYLRKYFYGFSACLLTVPVMINQESDANFETVMGLDDHGRDLKRRIYKNPRVKKIAMKCLPFFDRKGILDEF